MINVRKHKLLTRKSLIGKIIRFPLTIFPDEMVMRILTGPLAGRKWINASHNRSVWLGVYERSQTKLFVEKTKGKKNFWDLGAHAGYYTLLFNSCNKGAHSYSFEPLPKNVRYFKKHMALNHVTDNTLFEVAVYNSNGILKFSEEKTSVASKLSEKGQLEVQTIKLSEWVLSKNISLPDVIKIDIEGAEIHVLGDLKEILTAVRPLIFLSTHGQPVHEGCVQLLQQIGYKLSPIDHNELMKAREILCEG